MAGVGRNDERYAELIESIKGNAIAILESKRANTAIDIPTRQERLDAALAAAEERRELNAKPKYADLLFAIQLEEDEEVKEVLIEQTYVFNEVLTEEEKQVFNFVADGYVDPNPGFIANTFTSYVGSYPDPDGDYT